MDKPEEENSNNSGSHQAAYPALVVEEKVFRAQFE
jgi:hypothetical protein